MKEHQYTYLSGVEGTDKVVYAKVGRGVLHRIIVGTTNTTQPVEVWDGADGGANNSQIAQLKTNISEGSYEFNCIFAKGLYVSNQGGSKLTIVWS